MSGSLRQENLFDFTTAVDQETTTMHTASLESHRLRIAYAQFLRWEPFSLDTLFGGFTTLRVLTYSVSICMIVDLLKRFPFETVECVFGSEHLLQDLKAVLAFQQAVRADLFKEVQFLDDARKTFLLEQAQQGRLRFFVVKDAIAHSKIYLLETQTHRRVIEGSINLSKQAFSGKQAEMITVYDDDADAWAYYQGEYAWVKQGATSEVELPTVEQMSLTVEDIPLLRDAKRSKTGVTVVLPTVRTIPTVIQTMETWEKTLQPVASVVKARRNGHTILNREVVGKIVRLVQNQKQEAQAEAPLWLSIQRDTRKVYLSDRLLPLNPDPAQVHADARLLIEYFENFNRGFDGDVTRQQRDYFMFMSWFYLAPLLCDFRNQAISEQGFEFNFPMVAVLYGKSNCGKTKLIQTLMKSMVGAYVFRDNRDLTTKGLYALRQNKRRYPVVFDDVNRNRFNDYAPDIIKDETFVQDEYPAFVFSMNKDEHSFASDIYKRCLIIYTRAALPDYTDSAEVLHQRVIAIRDNLSLAFYRAYLQRVLERLPQDLVGVDILAFSSEILVELFSEVRRDPLPAWCVPLSIKTYKNKKYEKVIDELRDLFTKRRDIWNQRGDEVILKVQPQDWYALKNNIPDNLIRTSRAGTFVLHRKQLEEFIGLSLRRPWWERLARS